MKLERISHGSSQADLSKALNEKGFASIYPTTVAKIESGERAVRLDEAVAIADLFDLPFDGLLDREAGSENDRYYNAIRDLWMTAQTVNEQVSNARQSLQAHLPRIDGDELRAIVDLAAHAVTCLEGAQRQLAELDRAIGPHLEAAAIKAGKLLR